MKLIGFKIKLDEDASRLKEYLWGIEPRIGEVLIVSETDIIIGFVDFSDLPADVSRFENINDKIIIKITEILTKEEKDKGKSSK
jgi:hypothetical protein